MNLFDRPPINLILKTHPNTLPSATVAPLIWLKFFCRKKKIPFRGLQEKWKLCHPVSINVIFVTVFCGISILHQMHHHGYDKGLPDGMGRLSAYHQKKRNATEF